jgi:L-rhamnose mutarotase
LFFGVLGCINGVGERDYAVFLDKHHHTIYNVFIVQFLTGDEKNE